LNPALPDEDFDEAVRIAQAEFNRHHPDVVVGSSRGGAVAMDDEVINFPLWEISEKNGQPHRFNRQTAKFSTAAKITQTR
jgi:hypothetical protein